MSDTKNLIAISQSEILIGVGANEAFQIKIDDEFLSDDNKALAWVQIILLNNLAGLLQNLISAMTTAASPETARAAASAVSEETMRSAMRMAQEAVKSFGGTIPTVR